MFLLAFVVASLGFFCGPVLQLGAAWRHAIPGGLPTVGSFVLGLGITVFTMVEGLDQFEALYAAVVTGAWLGCVLLPWRLFVPNGHEKQTHCNMFLRFQLLQALPLDMAMLRPPRMPVRLP